MALGAERESQRPACKPAGDCSRNERHCGEQDFSVKPAMMRMVFRGISTPAIALCLVGAASTSDVQFTDITQQAKVDFKQENSATPNKYLIETMGGGVALLDYDNDGRLDVFFVNGARLEDPMPAGKQPDKRDAAVWHRLYRPP